MKNISMYILLVIFSLFFILGNVDASSNCQRYKKIFIEDQEVTGYTSFSCQSIDLKNKAFVGKKNDKYIFFIYGNIIYLSKNDIYFKFSSDGTTYGYIIYDGKKSHLLINGKQVALINGKINNFGLSPNGKYYAYTYIKNNKKWISINGNDITSIPNSLSWRGTVSNDGDLAIIYEKEEKNTVKSILKINNKNIKTLDGKAHFSGGSNRVFLNKDFSRVGYSYRNGMNNILMIDSKIVLSKTLNVKFWVNNTLDRYGYIYRNGEEQGFIVDGKTLIKKEGIKDLNVESDLSGYTYSKEKDSSGSFYYFEKLHSKKLETSENIKKSMKKTEIPVQLKININNVLENNIYKKLLKQSDIKKWEVNNNIDISLYSYQNRKNEGEKYFKGIKLYIDTFKKLQKTYTSEKHQVLIAYIIKQLKKEYNKKIQYDVINLSFKDWALTQIFYNVNQNQLENRLKYSEKNIEFLKMYLSLVGIEEDEINILDKFKTTIHNTKGILKSKKNCFDKMKCNYTVEEKISIGKAVILQHYLYILNPKNDANIISEVYLIAKSYANSITSTMKNLINELNKNGTAKLTNTAKKSVKNKIQQYLNENSIFGKKLSFKNIQYKTDILDFGLDGIEKETKNFILQELKDMNKYNNESIDMLLALLEKDTGVLAKIVENLVLEEVYDLFIQKYKTSFSLSLNRMNNYIYDDGFYKFIPSNNNDMISIKKELIDYYSNFYKNNLISELQNAQEADIYKKLKKGLDEIDKFELIKINDTLENNSTSGIIKKINILEKAKLGIKIVDLSDKVIDAASIQTKITDITKKIDIIQCFYRDIPEIYFKRLEGNRLLDLDLKCKANFIQ